MVTKYFSPFYTEYDYSWLYEMFHCSHIRQEMLRYFESNNKAGIPEGAD